jgi:hypothetical protein
MSIYLKPQSSWWKVRSPLGAVNSKGIPSINKINWVKEIYLKIDYDENLCSAISLKAFTLPKKQMKKYSKASNGKSGKP